MLAPEPMNYIAKDRANAGELLLYERILADGLRDFIGELATVNGGTIVNFICNTQHANLDDIIGSSTELMIKPGRLTYANHAAVEFDWGKVPSVTLAMELKDERVTTSFHMVFGQDFVGVDIRGILFETTADGREERLRVFRDAVADARLDARPG
ncbi:MAG TPA: hypothetical protein VFB16_06175 [Bauldia sp.]|nr:hypothetical protein [Bauldia sp.]